MNSRTIIFNRRLIPPEQRFKAKGLMSYRLSRPDNWDFTIEGLAHQNKEGAGAIARIIREAEDREELDWTPTIIPDSQVFAFPVHCFPCFSSWQRLGLDGVVMWEVCVIEKKTVSI